MEGRKKVKIYGRDKTTTIEKFVEEGRTFHQIHPFELPESFLEGFYVEEDGVLYYIYWCGGKWNIERL